MPSRIRDIRIRVSRLAIATAVVMLAAAACRSVPRVDQEPWVSALIVRNPSQFDVNVYTLTKPDAKPVWLGTVPAAGIRSLEIRAASLRENGTLVVQTRAIGSSRSWTSSSVAVDLNNFAVLDIAVDASGNCSASELRAISAAEVVAAIRE